MRASPWPGRQPCTPRLVDGRKGGGPSYDALHSCNPPTERRRDSPISSSLFPHGPPLCAESVLARSSRQRLGHLQSHFDGGWHVCQAVFPEPQSAASCRRVERLPSGSRWLVMEQLVPGICRLSCAFHAAGNSPPDVRRCDTGQ